MQNRMRATVRNLVVLALSLCMASVCAKGLKGSLEPNELEWFYNSFIPILKKHNLCTNVAGDCKADHIICMSHETLSCDVYGISDEKVIREIFLAMLNSDLNVSSFKFWKSKYHETSLFERPLLEYSNRTAAK